MAFTCELRVQIQGLTLAESHSALAGFELVVDKNGLELLSLLLPPLECRDSGRVLRGSPCRAPSRIQVSGGKNKLVINKMGMK